MADKTIEISGLTLDGEDKKGNPVFEARGTLNKCEFTARTIQYKGEPIFKVQEDGVHRGLEDSSFSRGDRIAVARVCKALRLELFGTGQKEKVESELETGETVELTAAGLEVGSAGLPEWRAEELEEGETVELSADVTEEENAA